MKQYGFAKDEKLKSTKLIEELFKEGKKVKAFPLLAIYTTKEELEKNQVGFSVPKKRFKRAVDRQLIKRRMRECYRLNKAELVKAGKGPYAVMFIYVGPKILDSQTIVNSMRRILGSIIDQKKL